MAKNFEKAGSAKIMEKVAKASAEKAQVITLKYIKNENLLDYPKNNEDISHTEDLEYSINSQGFTDPIEVTDFGSEDGKFTILSGHRRRAAGVKCGMDSFPCLVRHFDTESAVWDYVLFANSQRDSAKDPLLFCGRYKNHEENLKAQNFSGNIREEIAKRMGISVAQADRYNAMNKVILPVWDMVREEICGMSSVIPLAARTVEEQGEIYDIMQQALKKDVRLSREVVKQIVKGYTDGKKTWAEIADLPRDSGLPLNSYPTAGGGYGGNAETNDYDRNNEVRREYDAVGAEYDKMDADRDEWEREQEQENYHGDDEEAESEEKNDTEKQPPLSQEEREKKRGKEIEKSLEKLNTVLSEVYSFEDALEATDVMRNITSTVSILIDEMYNISREFKLNAEFENFLEETKEKISDFM